MSEDLIKRSDAIKAVWGDDINPSEDGMVFEAQSHIDRDIRLIPSADRPQEVIAEIIFDEEKLREIVKEAVERFKEEYEITDKPQEWIPCSERLPDACKDVLLTCEVRPINHTPFRYVCMAQWIPKFCEEALGIDWDTEGTEYCEEDDEFYPLEGWYESISNWDDYSLIGIGDFAIAWKPLPEPWKGADDGRNENTNRR